MRDLINLIEARQDPRLDREFRRWFRGSKVLDQDGAPLVVYHGTRRDFADFELGHAKHTQNPSNMLGIFFTASAGVADGFSKHWGEGSPNIRPCYLNIQRPWTINAMQFTSLFTRYSTHHQGDTAGFVETIRDNLEVKGFDGIRVTPFSGAYNPTYEFDNDVWVVFYPEQIRSMFDVKYPRRNVDEEFRDVDLWESVIDEDRINDAVWWLQRWISGSMDDPDWAEGEASTQMGFEESMAYISKVVGNRRGAAKPVLWRCLSLPKKAAQKVIETQTLPPWGVPFQSFSGKQGEALAFMEHLHLKRGHVWVLVSSKPDRSLIQWSMADLRASKNGKVGSYLLALDHWWDQDEVLVRITEPLPLLSAEIVKP